MKPPSFLLANRSFWVEASGANLSPIGSYEKHLPPLGSLRLKPSASGSPIDFVCEAHTAFSSVLTASAPDDASSVLPDKASIRIEDSLCPDECIFSRKITTASPLSFRIDASDGVRTEYPADFGLRDGTVRGVLLIRDTAQTDGVRDPLLDPCLLFLTSGTASFSDGGRAITCQPGTGWILLVASPVGKLRFLVSRAIGLAWRSLSDRPEESRLTMRVRRAVSEKADLLSDSDILSESLTHLTARQTKSGSFAEYPFAGWCRSESLARCVTALLRLGKEAEARSLLSFFASVLRQNPVLPPFLTLTGSPLTPISDTNAGSRASAALLCALSDTALQTRDPKPLIDFSPYLPALFQTLSQTLHDMAWGFSEDDPLLYSGLLPSSARLQGSSLATLTVIHACRRFEEAVKQFPGFCPDTKSISRTLRLIHAAGQQWESRFVTSRGILLCGFKPMRRPAVLYGVCDNCRGRKSDGIGSSCGSGLPSLPLTSLNRVGDRYLCLACQMAGETALGEKNQPAEEVPLITTEAALLLRKWHSDLLRPAEIEHFSMPALTSPETCGIRELTLLVDSEPDSKRRADYALWLRKRLSGRLMQLRSFEIAEACAALTEWKKQEDSLSIQHR